MKVKIRKMSIFSKEIYVKIGTFWAESLMINKGNPLPFCSRLTLRIRPKYSKSTDRLKFEDVYALMHCLLREPFGKISFQYV